METTLHAAGLVAAIAQRLGLKLIFKASFDKANRSSGKSFRGPGLVEGLKVLAEVRRRFALPLLTDVHEPAQCAPAAEVVDVLQIPAFLCRQTDLLVAAGRTGKAVNVKKGQFLAPEDMERAALKVEAGGSGGVLLTERGSTFGYHYLVVDFQGMARMAEKSGRPIVFDATHSVQQPGGGCGVSGGERRHAPLLARAAAAVGMDALFIEVHPDPDRALCDGPNSLPLESVEKVLSSILAVDAARRKTA
jgi:2-dehydro-3-deoxyphosphooctonate aldolase (KDO 8-P synthase)